MTNLSQYLFSGYVILSNVSCRTFFRDGEKTYASLREKSCSMQRVRTDTGEGPASFWMGIEGSTRHEPLSRRKINRLRSNQWSCSYKIVEISFVWHAKKKKKTFKKYFLKALSPALYVHTPCMINLVSVWLKFWQVNSSAKSCAGSTKFLFNRTTIDRSLLWYSSNQDSFVI